MTVAILLICVLRACASAPAARGAAHERGAPLRLAHTPGFCPLTVAILVFLYAPLLILVVYAFNASRLVTVWTGFSLAMVRRGRRTTATSAARRYNSLIIAVAATIASTLIATAGALALERGRLGFGRGIVDAA